jgi:hypothetical protein
MTPAEAAAILRVRTDATPAEVESAYRRRARNSHPDRISGGSAEEIAAATDEFARVVEAHEVMSRFAVAYPITPAPMPAPPEQIAQSSSAFIVSGWAVILVVASLVSYLGGVLPRNPLDLMLRLLPLTMVAIAYAITARRWLFVATLALTGISAALTLVFPSFGSLLALLFLLVPVIGLVSMGKRLEHQVGRHEPQA